MGEMCDYHVIRIGGEDHWMGLHEASIIGLHVVSHERLRYQEGCPCCCPGPMAVSECRYRIVVLTIDVFHIRVTDMVVIVRTGIFDYNWLCTVVVIRFSHVPIISNIGS